MPRAALRRWLIVIALLLPGPALAQLAHHPVGQCPRRTECSIPARDVAAAKEPVRVVGCTEGRRGAMWWPVARANRSTPGIFPTGRARTVLSSRST